MKNAVAIFLLIAILFCCSCTNQTGNDNVQPTHTHELEEWQYTVVPSCRKGGIETRRCKGCEYSETREVDARGHLYTESKVPPTLASKGYTLCVCDCGDSYIEDIVEALDFTENIDPTKDGTIWFYENFDNYPITPSTELTMSMLGWKIQGTANGAYTDGTANFLIVEHEGSKKLYVENNVMFAKDTYALILTTAQLASLHQKNYTYQFDLTYSDAESYSRYIALLTEYNGKSYNSFHLRNGGYAHNQCRILDLGFRYYDSTPSVQEGKQSVLYKLLGKNVDSSEQSLMYVSVSVRYVTDWQNGCKVYVRVNDESVTSKGEWVLVSSLDPGALGAPYFKPDSERAGVALKVGGAQSGYVDNIIIWCGTGDEPQDKTSPYLHAGAQ